MKKFKLIVAWCLMGLLALILVVAWYIFNILTPMIIAIVLITSFAWAVFTIASNKD